MIDVFRDYARALARYFVLILLAFGIMYAGRSFACTSLDKQFSGMSPDFDGGSLVLIDRRPAFTDYAYGDTVCYQYMRSRELTRRAGIIAAFPGDTFEANNGKLFVNGQANEPGYAPSLDSYIIPEMLVPRGYVLVVFNKRIGSGLQVEDHLVPRTAIVGKVIQ